MDYIFVGILGFLSGYAFEVVSRKRLPGVRPALFAIANALLLYSMVMVCLTSERFWLPTWAVVFGWILLPVSGLLFLRALFFELPFHRTFVTSLSESHLVTTGSYAVVRHPTVPLFLLILISILLVSKANLVLLAIPIWGSLDIVWAVLQERLVLTKMFPDYERYRKTTPMLLPDRRTMGILLNAFCIRKAPKRISVWRSRV